MSRLSTYELSQQLLETTDQTEVSNIINMFNLDLQKKEAIRASTYSDLQDTVTREITDRLDKRSGEFSNKELLDYLTAFDNIITKNKVDKIEVPQIAIQENINIINPVGGELDALSRQKIQRVIQQILSDKGDVIDGTVISDSE